MEAIICINKSDLATEEEIAEIKDIYEKQYKVVVLSGLNGDGISELEELISDKTVALAGPSGVGKSTILNQMIPEANMQTGAISHKTNRGKHTTRHVEIFTAVGGGLVYDTPGFTSFEILEAQEDNLMEFYPEFHEYLGKCYYDDCRHIKEPNCAVREAVLDGKINSKRYQSYLSNMEEIRNKKKY